MKIILLKDIPKTGNYLDLKKVKSGYGRNFLLPKKLAVLATRKNLKWREKQIKIKKEIEKENIENLKNIAEKLKKFVLEVPVKPGLKGQLFEKINETKIEKLLKKENFNIKKENIKIRKNIEKIGNYFAEVKLGEDIIVELKIKVKKGEKQIKKTKEEKKKVKAKTKKKK